jgi:hypothetical protein
MLALVVLKVRDLGVGLHTAVPLLPLLALGLGVALDLGLRSLYGWALNWFTSLLRHMHLDTHDWASRVPRLGAAVLTFVFVVSPVGLALASDIVGLASTLTTAQDATLATPSDAQATAAFVLRNAHPGDLILASPELAWIFDAPPADAGLRGADLLQTVAQGGHAAAFYPAGLPPSHWAYDVSLNNARYVVVDNLLRALATANEEPALITSLHVVEEWPVALSMGQYTVYERPGGG